MGMALKRLDKLDHKTIIILLFVLFILSCVIRSVFACYSKSLMIYPDEIRYIDISRSLYSGAGIMVHNVHMSFDQILYPILLIPFHFIKDQILQINAIAVFNSILISSVIFPAFLLGKKIIKNNSIVLLLLFTILLLPDLSMSITFMSENLFYPLSAWLIYFVFRFWDSDNKKEKTLYCILSAAFCFFAYLTKVVAVYFIGAFLLALAFDCLLTKKNTVKQNIKYGILFCVIAGGAILGFKLLIYLLLGAGNATYSGNRRLSVYDLKTFLYFLYAILFNGMFALIAFFYFPVVVPLFRFKRLGKSEKNMLVFALSALVIMIVIITLSISLNEDFPELFMRQHTRYYAPLLILFLTLFYKECFVDKDAEATEKPKCVPLLAAWTVFSCMVVFGIFRFISNVCIDGVLLQALNTFGEKLATVTGDPNEFQISWQLVLIKSVLILGTAAFTVILFHAKTQKAGTRVFVALILAVSVLNNICAMKEFKRIYEKKPDIINQAIAVNQYISENDCGNVLVITNGYDPELDTYLTGTAVYWTKEEDAEKLLGDQEYIDLTEQKIISNYPWKEYGDLSSVDYIITDSSVAMDRTKCEKILIEGLSHYSILKNNDTNKLYIRK